MDEKKVLVAMSGGIDSSVCAAVLKQRGFEVTGVYMRFLPNSLKDEDDLAARKSAQSAATIGIDYFCLDLREKFKDQIIDYFIKEYSLGYTPNPCVRCNSLMKFEALLKESQKIGAGYIATGHYVRIEKDQEKEEFHIKRGLDETKDQSYFLYLLSQRHLARTVMPLGEKRKDQVKKEAKSLKLPLLNRKESQEICFVPDKDYVRFIKKESSSGFVEGPILDERGNILGKHLGYAQFTIGQRKGLGLSSSQPLYVLDIDPKKNSVIVGPERSLYKKTLNASQVNWISGQDLKSSLSVKAQIRYNHKAQDAVVIPKNSGQVEVKFKNPQRAITPGQSVVFYDRDILLGGGTIMKDSN